MFVDRRLTFTSAQALTSSAALTDTIDLGQDRDLGPGEPMWWVIQLDVASDGANSDETYSFALQTDDTSAFSSPTTLDTIVVPRSTAAGTRYWVGLPQNNERHLRVSATLAGTTPSVTVTSFITAVPPSAWQAYPAAITK